MRDLTNPEIRKAVAERYLRKGEEESCCNCIYWCYDRPSVGNENGECRKRAPVVVTKHGNEFPLMKAYESCGEFEKA